MHYFILPRANAWVVLTTVYYGTNFQMIPYTVFKLLMCILQMNKWINTENGFEMIDSC